MKKTTTMSAKNKKFHALTKAEKRIAIAKDVLKWISKDKINPVKGTYVKLPGEFTSTISEESPLDKVFETEQCKACALGACFIAMVDLGNNIKLGDIFKRDEYDDSFEQERINDWDMKNHLNKIFNKTQMDLIESAFETDDMSTNGGWKIPSPSIQKAINLGYGYDENSDRLKVIMKNIIKNKGTFKP